MYSIIGFSRKIIKISLLLLIVIGVLSISLFISICLIFRLDSIENYSKGLIEDYANDYLAIYQTAIKIDKLELALPFSAKIFGLELLDANGTFSKIEDITLNNNFFSLFNYEVIIAQTGIKNIHIYRLPLITIPKEETEKKLTDGQIFLPEMEKVFNNIADLVFQPSIPYISLENIYAENILIDKSFLAQFKKQFSASNPDESLQATNAQATNAQATNTQATNAQSTMEDLHLSFNINVKLNQKKLQFESHAQITQSELEPMEMTASFEFQKSKELMVNIDYNDENGSLLFLLNEIFNLPYTKNDYAKLKINGNGTFSDFKMGYDLDFNNAIFLKKPATITGEIGISPYFVTINTNASPRLDNLVKSSDFNLTASLFLLSEENKEANQSEITDILKIIRFKYNINAENMEFISEKLQQLLGNKQESQGEVDLVFSKFDYPYLKSNTIDLKTQNLHASIEAFLSYDIDLKIKAQIADLKFLSSDTQNILGSVESEIIFSGNVNKIFYDTNFKIPLLKIEEILHIDAKTKEKQKDFLESITDNNSEFIEFFTNAQEEETKPQKIELKNLEFSIRSNKSVSVIRTVTLEEKEQELTLEQKQGFDILKQIEAAIQFEKSSQNQKNTQEQSQKENLYGLQVVKLFQELLNNDRKPLPLSINLTAIYNNMPVNYYSQIVVTPEILGINTGKTRFLELNNIKFNGFGANLQGGLKLAYPGTSKLVEDLKKNPFLKGKLSAKLKNSDILAKTTDLPLEILNLGLDLDFSTSTVTTNDKLEKEIQNINFKFSSDKLKYANYEFEQNSTQFKINDFWNSPSINGNINISKLNLDIIQSQNFQLSANGPLENIKINSSMAGNVLNDASMNFNGSIGLNTQNFSILTQLNSFEFKNPKTKTDIRLKQKGKISYSASEFSAEKIHFTVAPMGEFQVNGIINPEKVSLDGWWKDIDLSYLPLNIDGLFYGRFGFSGTSSNPTGYTDMRIVDFKSNNIPPVSIDINGKLLAGKYIHELLLTASLVDKEKLEAKNSKIEIKIPIQSEPRLRIVKNAPISGTIQYEGKITPIWHYVPLEGTSIDGDLFVNGTISGNVQKPMVKLIAKINDAQFEDYILGILLKDIDFDLNLDHFGKAKMQLTAKDDQEGKISFLGEVNIPWLSFGSYEPPITIKGKTPTSLEREQIEAWKNSLAIVDINATLDHFKPLQRSDVDASLSGNINVLGPVNNVSIGGKITIDKGEIHLSNIQSTSIPSLNIVQNPNKRPKINRRNLGNFNLDININNNFFVYGPDIETEWAGLLKISGKTMEPAISGSIKAISGEMSLLEREFILLSGEVQFDGSTEINPIIDIKLGYDDTGRDIKVELSGTPQNPKLRLTSVPYLPQDEILAHILFFSSISDLSDFEKIQLATTVTSLAGFNFSGGIRNIGKKLFGIDVIKINDGNTEVNKIEENNDNISIEIGKYVTDDLYVGVEQGISEQETFGITNYEINNNLSTGIKAGTDGAEINFEWRFDY